MKGILELEIGEKPMLWHIMKHYSHFGFHDFIICAGYKQHIIKEWFADYSGIVISLNRPPNKKRGSVGGFTMPK